METLTELDPPEPTVDQVEAEILDFELERRRRLSPDPSTPTDDDDTLVRSASRPEITISPDIQSVLDAAEQALSRLGDIYVRGRQLVHVIRDRGNSDWIRRPDGTPTIVAFPREGVIEQLSKAALWYVQKPQRDGGFKPQRIVPPTNVAAMLMARGQWPLPQLDGISDAPVFRADGTIHDTPGYDPQTRMIFDPRGAAFPAVPQRPTQAQATQAIADLLEPFAEFPFVGDTDRAAVAAAILSILGRPAIDGVVPMFASQAPTPGSGKGLLVDVISMIALGRKAPLMAQTEDDEEVRKRLMAIALESPAMVVIDNVDGTLGSPVLAMALTAGQVSDRKLGSTEMITATLRPVWCFTGNNVQLKGDMGRRVVPIDLDPKVEHPEDRTFKRDNLLGYVEENRPRLVTAALTVLRAFVVAGRPAHDLSVKGSFEAWDRLIRAAVIWARGDDPLGGVERIRKQSDDDLEQIRSLYTAWHDTFSSQERTVADVVRLADNVPPLRDALSSWCKSGRPEAKRLGYVLRKLNGRIVGGFVMRKPDQDRDGTSKWAVHISKEDNK
jgi:putative DNA primase/helicase